MNKYLMLALILSVGLFSCSKEDTVEMVNDSNMMQPLEEMLNTKYLTKKEVVVNMDTDGASPASTPDGFEPKYKNADEILFYKKETSLKTDFDSLGQKTDLYYQVYSWDNPNDESFLEARKQCRQQYSVSSTGHQNVLGVGNDCEAELIDGVAYVYIVVCNEELL